MNAARRKSRGQAAGDTPVGEFEPAVNIVNLSDSEFAVLTALREIGYGQVEVVVHGSRIVQITRSERVRVEEPRSRPL
ncbi:MULTISPECIES: DUF2292 domain-containing protein [unclassified Lysobacter]|uniref:DUF2292 domain-containing protein n=1 Tax=unclassified Lysobacter TaxID=2635362 RepID=UPI0006F60733|nr:MULTISPECIES: DUF2292 domain-containing protein [unclassified Lysobacter]KRA17228.1 hypothetical protein ASD69_10970 [Lysobacter sp. Root604]KRD31304.1 hypothetical protein ASE35_14935 [Lysobacter sp. Root916]KRD76909.1 hypothetical protein ASE43_06905 [Lysobacter sp. Root983]